ncbi:glycerol-3-phosphate 1-O-acyltransferase PlsB [Psychromonas sp. GE-S-Ul-11]|uniref:glycerol-3-phosphate 1-O-acyltransferase PlsB n=1 Tax=Psychromonas sp. GE-S-Ul-11 TaxID=3241170 RepID=UPI00390C45A2
MLATGTLGSRITNRFWVKNTVVPRDPLSTFAIDSDRPIIYVLAQNCPSDLLALQKGCQQAALPDPFQSINIAGEKFSSMIFLHEQYWFKKAELKQQQATHINQYQRLSNLLHQHRELDVQLIPVTFFWGRNPGSQVAQHSSPHFSDLNRLQKASRVLRFGRELLIQFNSPISAHVLLKKNAELKVEKYVHRLAKVGLHSFNRLQRCGIGLAIPARQKIIKQLLESEQLQQEINQYCAETGLSETQVTEQCQSYLQEISSQFSYRFIRFFRTILGRVWNGIYQGIEVNNAQTVRDATQSGAEIVYMPCHRSHMDYLLLSYLLYEEGLMPPHIAAGVNLNFFPAGGIFRRSGAFFIRRSFKGDPLYSKVFKAYFSMLFKQGYPIEFFTEGGRSRTGRLLPPKIGLLTMSVDTFLAQTNRNVVLVPIYIGYDHIMEVSTYMKELSGKQKKQENLWQVLGIIKKLGNFGRAFVNFGEPISLKNYFDQQTPQWRENRLAKEDIIEHVNHIAGQVMQGINQATAVNALPLCAAILLASTHHQLSKQRLLNLIALHQQLFGLSLKNTLMTYPTQAPEIVYQQALAINKFSELDNVISANSRQSAQLTYYRNTIVHLFALPALLSFCLIQLNKHSQYTKGIKRIQRTSLEQMMKLLLPFVEAEYFLVPSVQRIAERVRLLLFELQTVNIVRVDGDFIEISHLSFIKVLSAHLNETRLRYHCVLSQLILDFQQSDEDLITASKRVLTTKSIEPFDQKVIEVFIKQLDRQRFTIDAAQQLLDCLSDQ